MSAMEIPGYTLVQTLGESYMASVYLATQGRLNRPVALKVLNPTLADNDSFTERFINEGRLIDQLRHPHIVPLFEFGFHQEYYYFSMEFLPGGTLTQHIQQGLKPERALTITRLIAGALAHAHQRHILHRDLKPQNILFRQDNSPVLTDFGIARVMDSDPSMTVRQVASNSLRYISPEQATGQPLDGRSDLYSLGTIFYEMLTQRPPWLANDVIELLALQETIPELPDTLKPFQPILNKLLARKPEDRFANAEELIDALRPFETSPSSPSLVARQPRAALPAQAKPESGQSTRAQSLFLASASFLLVTALAISSYLFLFRPPVPATTPGPQPATGPETRRGDDQKRNMDADADAYMARQRAQEQDRQRSIEEKLQRGIEAEVKRQASEAERLRPSADQSPPEITVPTNAEPANPPTNAEPANPITSTEPAKPPTRTEPAKPPTRTPTHQAPPQAPSGPPPAVVRRKAAEPARPAPPPDPKPKAVAKTEATKTRPNTRCGNLLSRITLGEPLSNQDRLFMTKECQ